MEENEISPFDKFEKRVVIRKQLLPIWIKIFCWIFLIMGGLAIVCLIFGAFGFNVDLSLYGFETNKPISMIGLFITSLLIYKGFVAYCLLFEKENAINLAKIDAVIGIVISFVAMFILPFIGDSSTFQIRLELLLLIPYYRKIDSIEYAWDNLEHQ
jgi:hypothetical protein